MKAKRLMAMLLGVLLICGMFPQAVAESLLPGYAEMAPVDNGHYHDWTGYWVTVEPTCSSYGEKVRQCRECGEREKQIVDKLPHTFGEWEILTEATDHSSGLRQHTCEVCGEVVKESYDPEGTLRPGAHGDKVQRVQQDLVDQGYLDRHSVTRDYDWLTEQGIKEFQKAQGFTPDGIGWPQTLDCLRHEFGVWVVTKEPTDTELGERERTCVKCGFTEKETIGTLLRPGDWRNDPVKVTELQEKLIELGYHIGKVDGDYGGKTEQAVKEWQKDNGFTPDGILWPAQWDILFPPMLNLPGTIWKPVENDQDDDPDERPDRTPWEYADPDDDDDSDDDDDNDDDSNEEPVSPPTPKAALPDAAGKGGPVLDAELKYEFVTKPGPEGYYNSRMDASYRLVLYNHTGYTLKNVVVVPLTSYEWETMNEDLKLDPPFLWMVQWITLEPPEPSKVFKAVADEVGPYGSVQWSPFNLYYDCEYSYGGNGVYYLNATAFCDFYDGDEFVGSTKPTAEATVKVGPEKAYDLSAELQYDIFSAPANGNFYTSGETVQYNLVLTNTSDYDIKGINGYRTDKFNCSAYDNGGGNGIAYSSKDLIEPGKSVYWGPFEAKVVTTLDGELRLDYAKIGSHKQGSDYGSLQDGGIDLISFAECTFEENGKKIGSKTVTANEFLPVDEEKPGAKIEVIRACSPENGEYFAEGETVLAEFFLTNTGNVDLIKADIGLGLEEKKVADAPALAPGETKVVYHYIDTADLVDAAQGRKVIRGSADCTFKTTYANSKLKVKDSIDLPAGFKPEATLEITEFSTPPNGHFYEEGEEIEYHVVIHNTGRLWLTSAEIKGGAGGESVLIGKQTNLPKATDSAPFSAKHKVTHEEAQNGTVTFDVTADAKFEHNMSLPLSASATSKTGDPAIMVNIAVSSTAPSGFYKRDELVKYVITVSNIGNVEIPMVDVYFETPLGKAIIDQIYDFSTTKTYADEKLYVGGADVAAGSLTVTASARGFISTEPSLEASDSATVPTGMLPVNVSIEVTELSSPKDYGYYVPNETIDYMVTVTNLGEETLPYADVSSYLPGLSTVLDTISGFPPAYVYAYPVSYVVKETDASAGQVAHMGEAVLTLPDDSGMTVDHTLVVKAGFPPSDAPAIKETEFCVRVPETKEDGTETTRIIFCVDHSMVKETPTAWKTALILEYGELEALADDAGKETVKREREAFFTWLEAEERESEALCEILKAHCADACNIVHTAKANEIASRLLASAQNLDGYDPIGVPGTNPDALIPATQAVPPTA